MSSQVHANNEGRDDKREEARELCYKLNTFQGDRKETFHKLFGRAGNNLEIWSNLFCEFGNKIFIGDDVFIHCNCVMNDTLPIHIGNRVKIGPNVVVHTSTWPKDTEQRNNYIENVIDGGVEIHDSACIGSNALICPGAIIEKDCYIGSYTVIAEKVRIGEGSYIGSGVVVTKNIPPKSKWRKQWKYNIYYRAFRINKLIVALITCIIGVVVYLTNTGLLSAAIEFLKK